MAAPSIGPFAAFARSLAQRPEDFFAKSDPLATNLRDRLRQLHEYATTAGPRGRGSVAAVVREALPAMYTDGLDAEQIWAELDTAQASVLPAVAKRVADAKKEPVPVAAPPAVPASSARRPAPPAAAVPGKAKAAAGAGAAAKPVPARGGKRAPMPDSDEDEDDFDDDEEEEEEEEEEDGFDGASDDEDEDEEDAAPRSRSRAPASGSGDRFFSVDDMEAFMEEGDEAFEQMKRGKSTLAAGSDDDEEAAAAAGGKGAGKKGAKGKAGKRGDADESSSDDDDHDDDDSIDLNAPIPMSDDDDGDDDDSDGGGGGAARPGDDSLLNRPGLSKEKRAKLAALLARGPRYEDMYGPRGGKTTTHTGDDDEEEEGGEEGDDDDGDDDGGSFVSGGSDDDYIDRGLGKGLEDDDHDDEDEEDEEDEEEEEEGDGRPAAKRRRVAFEDGDDDDASGEEADGFSDGDNDDGPSDHEAGSDDEEDAAGGGGEGKLSRHARERAALAARVAALEAAAIGPKHWSMTGEVSGTQRPANSLLDATFDVQQAAKLAPPVTPEATTALEDLIKQRIADGAWDDPVRRESAREAAEDAKAAGGGGGAELSAEKSQLGLGDIYAREYEERLMGQTGAAGDDPVAKAEAEAGLLLTKVFHRLDALTNFFFTPKPPTKEMAIAPAASVPALAMEEALPMAVSEATAAAPEEIYDRREGVLRSTGEMTADQRAAARRARKATKRKEKAASAAAEAAVARINPGLGNKHAKERALASIGRAAAKGTASGPGGSTLVIGRGAAGKRSREEAFGGGAAGGGGGMYSGAAASAAASGGSGSAVLPTGVSDRYSNSTGLFSRLQAEAQATIHGKKGGAVAGDVLTGAAAKGPRPGAAAARLRM